MGQKFWLVPGHIGTNGLLKQVLFAIDGEFLLAILNDCSDTSRGEHTAETCTGSTDLLGQGSLGLKGNLQFASIHLGHSIGVGADMGGDKFLHLVIGDELADTDLGIGRIVADNGQVLDIAGHKFVDKGDGIANTQKTANHNGHSVFNLVGSLFYGNKFVHDVYFFCCLFVIVFKMQIYYFFANWKKNLRSCRNMSIFAL